jgi:hypothetical protein
MARHYVDRIQSLTALAFGERTLSRGRPLGTLPRDIAHMKLRTLQLLNSG